MAAFSYQPHPFLLDSTIFLPNMAPTKVSGSQFYQPHPVEEPPLDTKFHESSCLEFDRSSKVALPFSDNEPSVAKKLSTDDDSTAVDKLENGEQVTQDVTLTDRKRRIRNGTTMNSAKSMDHAKEGKNYKKQKKCIGAMKNEKKASKSKADKKDQKKSAEEPPKGYIHVRARRGQATDSHSLAERVRREKISERMKILQCLVPGCDKVTGKALMLDEIINYVQSLQNQVEFLSIKLASVNPMFYDFGVDLEALMVKPELPSLQHCNPTQLAAFAETTTTAAATTTTAMATTFAPTHSYPLLDVSAALFLHQGQRPNVFLHPQDNGSLFWDMEDQRQKVFNSSELNNNNLGSFH